MFNNLKIKPLFKIVNVISWNKNKHVKYYNIMSTLTIKYRVLMF